jgi:hypothetical protein
MLPVKRNFYQADFSFMSGIALIHLSVKRNTLTREGVIDLFLLYFLVFSAGVQGLIGFIGHIFFADQIALMIGWPIGSPFQYEVGMSNGAWSLLGFLCIRWHTAFWLVTGLGYSFFLLGAAVEHIRQMIYAGDYAPYNVGMILPDVLVPVILLTLLYLKFRYDAS